MIKRQIAYLFLGVLVSILSFTVATTSTTFAQATPDTCDPTSNASYKIEQSQVLLSHDQGGAFIGPLDYNLPAGNYDVKTTSYDNHSGTNHPTQEFEQWYFEGYRNGQLVYTSPTTTDIPDDEDYSYDDFGIQTLPQIDQIRWVHAGYPNPGYHSVHPTCIEADTVVKSPSEPSNPDQNNQDPEELPDQNNTNDPLNDPQNEEDDSNDSENGNVLGVNCSNLTQTSSSNNENCKQNCQQSASTAHQIAQNSTDCSPNDCEQTQGTPSSDNSSNCDENGQVLGAQTLAETGDRNSYLPLLIGLGLISLAVTSTKLASVKINKK